MRFRRTSNTPENNTTTLNFRKPLYNLIDSYLLLTFSYDSAANRAEHGAARREKEETMKLVRLFLIFALLGCVQFVFAQSEALDGAGYPGSDYFASHTFQQSWTRINEVYQAAEDRFAADQKALDAERDRRNSRARGDAAQEAVAKWYVAECRKLAERRANEYRTKEAAQSAIKRFYTTQEQRRKNPDSTTKQTDIERLEQRDLPEFKNAHEPPDVRELPDFKSASPAVRRALSAWEQEQQRHDAAVKTIRQKISSELSRHLILKDKYRGDADLTALENKAHALVSAHYHDMLRQENARFEASVDRLSD